jgi:hypothetical protein
MTIPGFVVWLSRILAIGMSVSACSTPNVLRLENVGLIADLAQYEIRALQPGGRLLEDGWQIENFEAAHGDRPRNVSARYPIRPMRIVRNLNVEAQNIANDLSGSSFQETLGSAVFGERIGSKIVSQNAIDVGGRRGYRVTFDYVNLDQREFDPNAPLTRVDLVLVSVAVTADMLAFRSDSRSGKPFRASGLLILVHANGTTDHSLTAAAFEGLLTRFVFPEEPPHP